MDPFEKKHEMVQKLLSMLKNHAVGEVESGLKKPEGEGDMHGVQVEKVEVLPGHEMDEATPEHEVDTKLVDEGKATANAGYNEGGMAGYDKGGVVEKVNATDPTPKIHSGPIPYESANGQPDKEGSAHEETTESDEERMAEGDIVPTTLFESFLGRKKKK
jgi:hypothetical protein